MQKTNIRNKYRIFQSSFENAAVGMTHTSLQGRWLRVNRKLCEMTGYSEQELVEGSYQHITPSEDTPADTALIKRSPVA